MKRITELTQDLIDVCRQVLRDDRRAATPTSAGFLPTETRVALLSVLARCPRTRGGFAIKLAANLYYDGQFPGSRDDAAIYPTVASANEAIAEMDEQAEVVNATWLM